MVAILARCDRDKRVLPRVSNHYARGIFKRKKPSNSVAKKSPVQMQFNVEHRQKFVNDKVQNRIKAKNLAFGWVENLHWGAEACVLRKKTQSELIWEHVVLLCPAVFERHVLRCRL